MTSLILVSHDSLSVTATDAARALIEEAMAKGALIGSVRTPEGNTEAAEAQVALKIVRRDIEAAYRAAKDPIVQLGEKLDQTFRGLVEQLDREDWRIGNLAGEFALAERRRVAAAQILEKEALEKLEREKHAALAATADPVQQSKILEDFSLRAARELPLPMAPERADGQCIKIDWEIRLTNVVEFARWALVSGRWECMSVEVKKTAVKEMLRGGMKSIPGLECKEVTSVGVRLPRARKEIDV